MYNGFIIKIGNYSFPLDKIAYDSLSLQYITQDLDSYKDSDGKLHRNALEHKVPKVVFNTIPINNDDYGTIMQNINANIYKDTDAHSEYENAFLGTCFVPQLNGYVTTDMYMADSEPEIRTIKDGKIWYNPIRFSFIGY